MKNLEPRDEWVDVLRGLVALLVVVHHTALMYGAIGSWFWHEKSPDNSFSSLLLTAFCTFNQSWFMGLFFLLAGAYVPRALARKGTSRYLMDRLVRLGLPLLVFGCLLGPLTIALAFTSKGFSFQDTLMALWRQARFESGPLWFVAALWVMTCMITPFVPWLQRVRPFPSMAMMWVAALLVGASAFLIRLVWPVGQTWWIGWQLGYFPGYVLLFIAGVAGAQSRWWFDVPASSASTWRRVMASTTASLRPWASATTGAASGMAARAPVARTDRRFSIRPRIGAWQRGGRQSALYTIDSLWDVTPQARRACHSSARKASSRSTSAAMSPPCCRCSEATCRSRPVIFCSRVVRSRLVSATRWSQLSSLPW
eukprot:gene30574-37813_t